MWPAPGRRTRKGCRSCPPDLETLLSDHRPLGAADLDELLTAALTDRLRGADAAERARALDALPRAGLPTDDLLRLCAHTRGAFDDDARLRCAGALAALPGCPAARHLAIALELRRWQEEARKARWFVDGSPQTPIAGFAA